MPELSIVLPAYNEAAGLRDLVSEYRDAGEGRDFELIIVDNGSNDDTANILRELQASEHNAFLRPTRVDINKGYGFGIWSGLQEAKGTYLSWSHADTQCAPKDVFRAFDHLKGCDNPERTLVKGLRAKRSIAAEMTTIGMRAFALFLLDGRLVDINGQPKVFHRGLLSILPDPAKDLSFDLYVFYRALQEGWAIETIPVVFGERLHGQSRWAFSFLSRYKTIFAAIRYMVQLRFRG